MTVPKFDLQHILVIAVVVDDAAAVLAFLHRLRIARQHAPVYTGQAPGQYTRSGDVDEP